MDKLGSVSFEVEMVLAIIAGLIMAVIFYLNVRNLINRTNDVKRVNDTISLSEAISLYTVEKGHIPENIVEKEMEIATIDGQCKNICEKGNNCINLLPLILPYLEIKNLSSLDGYSVHRGKNGMVTVKSCISRSGKNIEVTR